MYSALFFGEYPASAQVTYGTLDGLRRSSAQKDSHGQSPISCRERSGGSNPERGGGGSMRTRKSDAIVLTLQTGLASLAGMLVVTGGIAHAQTVSESGKASAGARNMAGEESLVTAQRRQERLTKTPVTESAIGGRVIEPTRLTTPTTQPNR